MIEDMNIKSKISTKILSIYIFSLQRSSNDSLSAPLGLASISEIKRRIKPLRESIVPSKTKIQQQHAC